MKINYFRDRDFYIILQVIVTTERESNEKIEGFSTIIQLLIENSKYPDILGIDNEMKALSCQWLEYAVVCVNYADTPANAKRVLQVIKIQFIQLFI